ncbi:hypothetical protein ACFWAR_18770 [Streptomyces sp. NPDC059917]|uniref:hypothetical protein n=1 Tax=Streptomyces sp. NPDC059917 TaxID=3347002 RepID=UPI00365D34C0
MKPEGGLAVYQQVDAMQPPRHSRAWSGIAPGAEVVGGGTLLCAALYAQLASLAAEPYGRGYGGGIAVLFGLFVMVVFGPPLAFAAGCLHSLLFTTPVMLASNALGVRTRIAAPRWAAPTALVFAAGYALPLSVLTGAGYATTLGWTAAVGFPPVAVAVLARMRRIRRGRIRLWALGPIAVATLVTLVLGAMAPAYEPPVLGHVDLVGRWTGEGVDLTLGNGGDAAAEQLPVHDGFDVVGHCTGHGTWRSEPARRTGLGRRAAVVLTFPTCESAELRWEVAGTRERPELFVLMGDPDAGDVVVLHHRAD